MRVAAARGDAVARVLLDYKKGLSVKQAEGLVASALNVSEDLRSLRIEIGNVTLTADPNDPADLKAAHEMALAMMAPANSVTSAEATSSLKTTFCPPTDAVSSTPRNLAGTTLDELISRYATRRRDANSSKTSYEYEKMQRKFARWIHLKKNTEPYPIRLINRADISGFIDDLLADGVSAQTIQKKYLSAIGGVFSLAQTSGDLPSVVYRTS
ncbi:MAG: hypothetical protein DDT25_01317 [Chloroflexi bacterium]|nr:hypothetical protein [Chloroflexota bacterium]